MNTTPDTMSKLSPEEQETQKKKKFWRNLFGLNLALSVILIGLFWLPVKVQQMDTFMSSSSINLPGEGKIKNETGATEEPQQETNFLPAKLFTVNASSEENWTYFDLSRNSEVKIHDPSSLEWDLAFRRGKVISNGGATNKFGSAGLIDLGEIPFDSVAEVPQEKYVEDAATRTDTENPVLLKWYKYNYLTHKLTAKKNVYALRTANNKFAKIQFTNFYCDNDEPGCIQIKYVYQDNGSNNFIKPRPSWESAVVKTETQKF